MSSAQSPQRLDDMRWRWSVRLIASCMRQCQPPIARHNEVAATLQRVVSEPDGLALHAPPGVLPEDLRAVYAPDRVVPQAICTVDRACRVRQEAYALKQVGGQRQPALSVGRLNELALEERNPATQPLLIRE